MKKTMTAMALSATLAIPMAMTADTATAQNGWNRFWKILADNKCWTSTSKSNEYVQENCYMGK